MLCSSSLGTWFGEDKLAADVGSSVVGHKLRESCSLSTLNHKNLRINTAVSYVTTTNFNGGNIKGKVRTSKSTENLHRICQQLVVATDDPSATTDDDTGATRSHRRNKKKPSLSASISTSNFLQNFLSRKKSIIGIAATANCSSPCSSSTATIAKLSMTSSSSSNAATTEGKDGGKNHHSSRRSRKKSLKQTTDFVLGEIQALLR